MLAGGIGNALEWYDFAAYGYFAAIFAENFFPGTDRVAALASAFGVFAAAFLMRPIGGAIFGHVGDRHGRKVALLLSAGLMTCATVAIGLLPTHAMIGPAAPLLLVALRLLQGLSVGGEFSTSVVFLVERSDPRRRGILGAVAPIGTGAGTLLGSGVGFAVAALLDHAALVAWGWRVPFLGGIVLGGAAFVLRRVMADDALPVRHTGEALPLIAALRTEWRDMLRAVAIFAAFSASFYLVFVYLVTDLQAVDRLPAARALQVNTISMVVLLALLPCFGWLSDKVGRKPLAMMATGGTVLFAWPLLALMMRQDPWLALCGQLGFAVLIAAFNGPMSAMLVEMFRGRTRCTALSVSYNIAMAALGGTAPMVAVYLVGRVHLDAGPAWYLMALSAISFAGLLTLQDRTALPLR